MQEFLQIILGFPTVAFTALMGVIILYWLTVIAGVVDLDLFDLDADIDADIDLDLDVDVDVVVEVDVDADVDIVADADVDAGGVSGVVSVLDALGLIGVPLTISITLFTFFNWCTTFLASYALGAGQAPLSGLLQAGVLGGSLVTSLVLTSFAVRPLRPLFQSKAGARAANALIGHTVKVISGSVTASQGRAEMQLEGSTVNLSIRCEVPDNPLGRGDEALIIGYNAEQHTYSVEPLSAMLGKREDASSASHVSLEEAFQELEASQESPTKTNKP